MRRIGLLLLCAFIMFITACSNSSESKDMANDAVPSESAALQEQRELEIADGAASDDLDRNENQKPEDADIQVTERMVIYNADLRLEVKDFNKAQADLETLVKQMGGYVVRSEVYANDEERMEGSLTVRVPHEQFQAFMTKSEGMSIKVHSRNVTGQDVTEEYVDLESRLKSKKVVENRLLDFMEKAEKTEDLLKISNDLERVQTEIEQINGRMKYLENQTSLATITINLFENKVAIPDIEQGELNTWEKTKKQFINSINFLLLGTSAVVVFFVGNSPIFLILGILGFLIWIIVRRQRKRNNEKEPPSQS